MGLSTGYAIHVHPDGASSALLQAVIRQGVQTNSDVVVEENAGERFARHVSMTAQNPTASFSTRNPAVALGLMGAQGLTISGSLNPGLEFFHVNIDDDTGQPTAGSTHHKITCAQGLLYPVRLTAEQDGHAELEGAATIIYDGSNAPLVPAGSAALPAAALADAERFTVGKVVVAGVTVTDHLSVSVEFGLNVVPLRAEGDIWPTHLRLQSVQPVVRIRGAGVTQFATSGGVPLAGSSATVANTDIYFRKRSAGGFVANGTAEHIKINCAGLAHWGTVSDSDGNATAEVELVIVVNYDGTNAPLVVDTASAIT